MSGAEAKLFGFIVFKTLSCIQPRTALASWT